jgi:hypothetical protein
MPSAFVAIVIVLPFPPRVDFRDGFVRESSSFTTPFRDAWSERLRAAVDSPPALRSAADVPGFEVSIGTSRRGRRGFFGLSGPDRSER